MLQRVPLLQVTDTWEVDPFACPHCSSEMRMVALIDDNEVIERILRHLDLWPQEAVPARAPPKPIIQDYVIEPVLEDCQWFDEAIAGKQIPISNKKKSSKAQLI